MRGFRRRRPDVAATVLRFAPFIGENADTTLTRYFSQAIVPTVFGRDPRLQFVHADDALEILYRAVTGHHPGTFNVAGAGTITLSQAVRRAGRLALPSARTGDVGAGRIRPRYRSARVQPRPARPFRTRPGGRHIPPGRGVRLRAAQHTGRVRRLSARARERRPAAFGRYPGGRICSALADPAGARGCHRGRGRRCSGRRANGRPAARSLRRRVERGLVQRGCLRPATTVRAVATMAHSEPRAGDDIRPGVDLAHVDAAEPRRWLTAVRDGGPLAGRRAGHLGHPGGRRARVPAPPAHRAVRRRRVRIRPRAQRQRDPAAAAAALPRLVPGRGDRGEERTAGSGRPRRGESLRHDRPRRADALPRDPPGAADPAQPPPARGRPRVPGAVHVRDRPQVRRDARLRARRRAAAARWRAGRCLPGRIQGRRQALPRSLQAATLRPGRVRLGRARHRHTDHPGRDRRRRGNLSDARQREAAGPTARHPVLPGHADVPVARAAWV